MFDPDHLRRRTIVPKRKPKAFAGIVIFAFLTLLILPSLSAGTLSFDRAVVDPHPPEDPWYKMLGDIDGDGRTDIVIAGRTGPLVWYGFPEWNQHAIAAGGWDGVNGETVDLDGDGDIDIVMGGVVWFQNPGNSGDSWNMLRIDAQKAHDIEVADLDGDGKMDVVARDQSAFGGGGNRLFIYRQRTADNWDKRILDCPHGEGLNLTDLDADGDPDVIIGGRWYENDGDPVDGAWTEHIYATGGFDPDAKIAVADLNGDRRPDIILAPAELAGSFNQLVWFEAPEKTYSGAWGSHAIVPRIETVVHGLAVADFDADGRIDIAYAEMHQGVDPDEVCVMQNMGSGRWQKHVVSSEGSHDIVAGDVDGDGRLDLLGANWSGPNQPVIWWRNTAAAKQ